MLSDKTCGPCATGAIPMKTEAAKLLLEQLPGWELAMEGRAIRRRYSFKDFTGALAFANKVGAVAESEGHHPDLMVGYGYVECMVWTHSIAGLHENDFILASKINQLQA